MKDLPHRYAVGASAGAEGPIPVSSPGLEPLSTNAPAEFGGPGDRWSPETLLMASVVDCFVLTFRAVARASSLAFETIECEAEGVLDQVERKMRFTGIGLRVHLTIPAGQDAGKALRLLEKSERNCLVSNSLACPVTLEPSVATSGRAGD